MFHRTLCANRWVSGLVLALLIVFSANTVVSAGTITRFTVVDSSPSSWVARGYSDYTVTEQLGWMFTPGRNFDNGISFNIEGSPLAGTSVTYWRLNFAAPGDAEITPGLYSGFQRWPFQDANRPGLEFASTGRLDNMASGFFEVHEVTYGMGGEVLTFSADFTHYGEANLNNWAHVEIRYNIPIPEPGVAAMLMLGATCVVRRRRRCAA